MKLKTGFLTALGTAILSLPTLQLAQAAFVENQYNCENACIWKRLMIVVTMQL